MNYDAAQLFVCGVGALILIGNIIYEYRARRQRERRFDDDPQRGFAVLPKDDSK